MFSRVRCLLDCFWCVSDCWYPESCWGSCLLGVPNRLPCYLCSHLSSLFLLIYCGLPWAFSWSGSDSALPLTAFPSPQSMVEYHLFSTEYTLETERIQKIGQISCYNVFGMLWMKDVTFLQFMGVICSHFFCNKLVNIQGESGPQGKDLLKQWPYRISNYCVLISFILISPMA